MIRLTNGDFFAQANPDTGAFAMRWKRFSSHVAISNNKFKRDRYAKVAGNSIVYGGLTRFSRAAAFKNIHHNLTPGVLLLKQAVHEAGIVVTDHQWVITMRFAAPLGYGAVGMRNTKKGWVISGGDEVTQANWDIDNQHVWQKCWKDICQKKGLLDKDTVDRVVEDRKRFVKVPTFAERSLTFVFHPDTP